MAIEKIKILGKGNFGVVYLVKNKDKLYALKKIYNSDNKSFYNEVKILSKLNHQNIIKLFHHYQKKNYCNMIIEYVDNGTLEDKINNNIKNNILFTFDQIKDYMLQMSDALKYIHSKNIIHRDIKPANLLITSNNIIKLADFGVSKVISFKIKGETFIGTPYYLSPELVNGEIYNTKVDYWALGCILYELISLKKPFDGKTLYMLILKINNCNYDLSIIPIKYHKLLNKLLNKNPNFRGSYRDINIFFYLLKLPRINITFNPQIKKEPSILDLVNNLNNINRS